MTVTSNSLVCPAVNIGELGLNVTDVAVAYDVDVPLVDDVDMLGGVAVTT